MTDVAIACALAAALWIFRPSNVSKAVIATLSIVVIVGTIVRVIWWP